MRVAGSSGSSERKLFDELGRRLDRDEIGLGEVAVVVRLLLGPSGGELPRCGVEVVGLLPHLVSRLPDTDLPLDLGLDPARDEVERVHVLDLGPRAQLVGAGGANRDVGIDAQRPLLHLRVRDPELDDRLTEKLEEPLRLVRGPDVRCRDDLDERRPASVVVDEREVRAADPSRVAADVNRLGRVLLEVRTHDPDHTVTIRSW